MKMKKKGFKRMALKFKKSASNNKLKMWLIPLFFILLTIAAYLILAEFKKKPELKPTPEKIPPFVDVQNIEFSKEPLKIKLNGTALPVHRIKTASELSGKISFISPKLAKGGYFKKGELMVKIEDFDYRDDIVQAKLGLAEADLAYQKEVELSIQAEKDWNELGLGQPSDLVLRKPHMEKIRTQLENSKALVAKAVRNLNKTKVKAPFDLIVSSKNISLGTFVSPGSILFEGFDVSKSEIRIALSPDNADFIDLPKSGKSPHKKKNVSVFWKQAGETKKREAYISRVEGEIDPETRFQYLVVNVDDPYSLKSDLPELKMGRFVNIEIPGKIIEKSFLVPMASVNQEQKIIIANQDNTISFKKIEILKRHNDLLLIRGDESIKNGDRIVISPLEFAVEGTKISINGKTNNEN